MKSCPDLDTLKSILDGLLAEPEAAACAAHVRQCTRCQQHLNELSDDPDVQRWAAAAGPPDNTSQLEPRIAQLVAELCDTTGDRDFATLTTAAVLAFLGPPRAEGDLGTIGPYRVLGEVGRGGMGIVLRGLDETLNRTVAIKVLRPELASAPMRARLFQEAQAAARFQHDHVVRIYAVASTAEGLPYLVMEYLDGETLDQRLRGRHGVAFPPAEAVALAVQVADGLSAAHAAGLVHRDVKPSNLHRDGTGRVRILDFGLARLLERSSGTTQEGTLAGTPAYMSPEQVQGLAALDGRTDVYSLGVTLYELLTAEAPFRGTPHRVLQQVLREDPRPPRQLSDAIPRDLETICLKALAKEPAQRYQTAGDFAADLRRWQRGEPVQARPLGRLGRLGRWCRRNPRVAVLAALLLLVLMGGFAGVSSQWYRAEGNLAASQSEFARAEINLAKSQQEFARAEENFQWAVEAVDYYHTRISEEKLLNQSGLQPLRKDLLEAARKFYARFVAQHKEDPAVRREYARALFRLANLTYEVGSLPRAIALMEEAAVLQKQLADADATDVEAQIQLARVLNNLGNLYRNAGQFDRAEAALGRSLGLSQRLVREQPSNPAGLRGVYRNYNNLGYVFYTRNESDKAVQAFEKAISASDQLAKAWPHEPAYRREQIQPLIVLGLAYQFQKEGHLAQADAAYRKALTLAEGLVRDFPGTADDQAVLADCCARVGWVELVAGRSAPPDLAAAKLVSGRAAQQRALKLMRQLVRANPALLEYQFKLWERLNGLGYVEQEAGRLDEAEAAFRESLQLTEPLARDHPEDPHLAVTPAVARESLANVLSDRGQFAAALDEFDRAGTQLEKILRTKDLVSYRMFLGANHVCRALTLLELKRYAAALADWEQVIALDTGNYRHIHEAGRALTQARLAGTKAAVLPRPLYVQAAAQAEESLKAMPVSGGYAYFLAQVNVLAAAAAGRDDQLSPAQRSGQAARYAARAVDLLRRAEQAGYFRVPGRRQRLAQEPEWEPLRGRRDFQQLLAESSGKAE